MKKIIAINASPRGTWNTAQLVQAAARGAEASGAEVEYIDLYKLDNYKGCISCFGCKREKTYGICMAKDDLTPVLEAIREADGLILGSPNYLSEMTASFRALYERLVFQSLTYNLEEPNCNKHMIPVVLIMTTNCPEEAYAQVGYDVMLEKYQGTLSRFVGPTEVLACGNTLQVKDYSQFKWTMFKPEDKKKHHDETFDEYKSRAFAMGEAMGEQK